MEFKIEKYAKKDFVELLAKTCNKFKVDYTVEFSEEIVIGTRQVIDNRREDFYGGFTLGSKTKTYDIMGFVATVEVPELNRMEETGFLYLGCVKDDEVVSVHPTGYATDKGFQLTSLKEEIESFPCAECGKKIARKIIHVFESPEGEIAVYGSGCSVKKFGINFTSVMDKFFNAISVLESAYDGDDDYFSGGSGASYLLGSSFALFAFHNIYKYGYVSGSKAWSEGGCSTKAATLDDMTMIENDKDTSQERKDLIKNIKDFTDTTKLHWEEFVAWIPSFQETLNDDDFGFNMNQVCEMFKSNGVSYRMAGYAT